MCIFEPALAARVRASGPVLPWWQDRVVRSGERPELVPRRRQAQRIAQEALWELVSRGGG